MLVSDTSRQQLRQVQQILESECEGVEQIRPRISQASHDSRISEVDRLPHQLPVTGIHGGFHDPEWGSP
eukprot:s1560_g1.t1